MICPPNKTLHEVMYQRAVQDVQTEADKAFLSAVNREKKALTIDEVLAKTREYLHTCNPHLRIVDWHPVHRKAAGYRGADTGIKVVVGLGKLRSGLVFLALTDNFAENALQLDCAIGYFKDKLLRLWAP